MRRTLTSAAALLLVAAALIGTPARAATATVTVRDVFFSPQEIHVDPGDTVTWNSAAVLTHDVTSDTGLFASGEIVRGRSFSHTFPKKGTYYYHCSIHGSAGQDGMWGVVVVGDPKPAKPPPGRPRIDVPGDFKTIQAAVDAAPSGSTIFVAPGRYKGDVTITTDDLVLRGVDRYRTVLHGADERATGIAVEGASDVTIANLTVRNFVTDGLSFVDAHRYTAKGIEAINNRMHGVSATRSYEGVIRSSFGWGSGEAAYLVAECMGCGTLLENVEARRSHTGVAAINATGVTLRGSAIVGNGVGVALLSDPDRAASPGRGALLMNNFIRGSGDPPPLRSAETFGIPRETGVWVAGVDNAVVRDNRVHDTARYGILVSASADGLAPNRNEIAHNAVLGGDTAPVAWDGAGADNCFERNEHAPASSPPTLDHDYSCDKRPFTGEPYPPVQEDVAAALPESLELATADAGEPDRPDCQKGKPGCHRH